MGSYGIGIGRCMAAIVEQNKGKNIFEFVPKDIEVKIPVPKRQIIKRKLFTFLDEEEINGE